jgi:hypothetical protein
MIHLFLAQVVEATASPAATAAGTAAATVVAAAPSILTKLCVGLLLGGAGQGARTIVGLKKTSDEAKAKNTSFSAQFDAGQLFVSLLIGAIAGLFAALAMWDKMGNLEARQTLLALVAAGYAGADFIEGFMRNEATATNKTGAPAAVPLRFGLGSPS